MALSIVPSNINISTDEGSSKWLCKLTLLNISDFELFQPRQTFSINLDGDTYNFYVTAKNMNRNSPEEIDFIVEGESLSIDLQAPYIQPLTQTWTQPVSARDVVLDLLQNRVTWDTNDLVDWMLPVGSISAEKTDRIELAKSIVETAGGVLECNPDGTLYVRHLFPYSPCSTSINNYSTVIDPPVFTEVNHLFSSNTQYTDGEYVDWVRVRNSNTNESDKIEFTQCENNPLAGHLRVYPYPWRDVRVITTSPSDVTLQFLNIETREETETIEVFEGKGSVKFPITEILEITYNEVDLEGFSFELYKTDVTAMSTTEKNGMATIKYQTQCLLYYTTSVIEQEVQYLVEDWSLPDG